MTLNPLNPILYLITRGATNETTTPDSEEFRRILQQVSAAVSAGIQLIQIREKELTARVLFELTGRVATIARGSSTRVLVNDRADIAAAAGADGVHLTTQSVGADVIRRTFGEKFLIGASTHSVAEARDAATKGADLAVFGPVFPSPSKQKYGSPLGVRELSAAVRELSSFPVIALGGISLENVRECLLTGAAGVAGISLFSEPDNLSTTVDKVKADLRREHSEEQSVMARKT